MTDLQQQEFSARQFLWRRRILTIQRDPELAALIDTLADVVLPPETFDEDRAKYHGIAATADDYLQFGHFSHCVSCYQAIALYPSHRLNFPGLTPHECGKPQVLEAPKPRARPEPRRAASPGWTVHR